jgi:hypothetical protein
MVTLKRKIAALLLLGAKVGNPYHDKFGRFGSSDEGGTHEKSQQAASATRSAVAASIKADKSGNAEDHKAAADLHQKAAVLHAAASHEGSMQQALFHDSAVDAHLNQASQHKWLAGAKMNENHDERGRFAAGSGGGSVDPVSRTAERNTNTANNATNAAEIVSKLANESGNASLHDAAARSHASAETANKFAARAHEVAYANTGDRKHQSAMMHHQEKEAYHKGMAAFHNKKALDAARINIDEPFRYEEETIQRGDSRQ